MSEPEEFCLSRAIQMFALLLLLLCVVDLTYLTYLAYTFSLPTSKWNLDLNSSFLTATALCVIVHFVYMGPQMLVAAFCLGHVHRVHIIKMLESAGLRLGYIFLV